MKYLLFIILAVSLSCKPSGEKPSVENSNLPPPSEADLGALYQYYHSNPKTLEQKDENALIAYAADKGYDAQRTQSGVFIVERKRGTGSAIKWGDKLFVNYRGTFLDGKEFDSSYKRRKPLDFRVGQMVAGWNEALIGRQKGDEIIILIPSHMGYGKKGFTDFVPPDANLVFDIVILDGQ